MSEAAPISLLLVLVLLALLGAYLDTRYRRLPNWLCLAVLLAGALSGLALHDAGWMAMSLLHAAIALLVGMVLFALRAIGGGDAKYYAAFAAWFPLKFAVPLFVATSLAGLPLAVVWIVFRRLRPRPAIGAPEAVNDFAMMPYGVAIAAGAVFTYTQMVA